MRNPGAGLKAVKLAVGLTAVVAIALLVHIALQVRSTMSQTKNGVWGPSYSGSTATSSGEIMVQYTGDHPRAQAFTGHLAYAVTPTGSRGDSLAIFGPWSYVALRTSGAWESWLSVPYVSACNTISMASDGAVYCVLAEVDSIEVRYRSGGLKERHSFTDPRGRPAMLHRIDCNNRSGTIAALASEGVYITAIGEDSSRDHFVPATDMNTVTTSHLGDLVACDNSKMGSGGNVRLPDQVIVVERDGHAVAKLSLPWSPRLALSLSLRSELRFTADDSLMFLLTCDGILYRWRRTTWDAGYDVLRTPFPCTAINPIDEDTLYVGGDGVIGLMGKGPGAADSATTVAVPGLRWIRAVYPMPDGKTMVCIDENARSRTVPLPRSNAAP